MVQEDEQEQLLLAEATRPNVASAPCAVVDVLHRSRTRVPSPVQTPHQESARVFGPMVGGAGEEPE